MEVYSLDECILLHCMLLVSYIQQYFNTSIIVLTNQVWKLLIALFKMLNTGAFTVTIFLNYFCELMLRIYYLFFSAQDQSSHRPRAWLSSPSSLCLSSVPTVHLYPWQSVPTLLSRSASCASTTRDSRSSASQLSRGNWKSPKTRPWGTT